MKSLKTLRSRIALEYEQAKHTSHAQELCDLILDKLELRNHPNGIPLSHSSLEILRRSPSCRNDSEVEIFLVDQIFFK